MTTAEQKRYQKVYRAAHREKLQAQTKAYQLAHREEIQAQRKAYRIAHRTETAIAEENKYHKAYYAAHREKILTQVQAYRLAQREKIRDNKKAYQIAHREEIRAYCLAHREVRRAQSLSYAIAHREETRAKQNAYNASHREEAKKKTRAYYKAHPGVRRKIHLKSAYGLSPETFQRLLANQGGVCAICGKADWSSHGPCVDHDHATGKVRGILCNPCNTALGLINDDLDVLQAMNDYLHKFNTAGAARGNK